jgi:hypothetical protein
LCVRVCAELFWENILEIGKQLILAKRGGRGRQGDLFYKLKSFKLKKIKVLPIFKKIQKSNLESMLIKYLKTVKIFPYN